MNCLIVSGGSPPSEQLLKQHITGASLVIAADGAANLFKRLHMLPHVLIGDFDSAEKPSVQALEQMGAAIIRLKREKNETDTQAAVDYAIEAGVSCITLLGATGMRTDHLLANLSMLVRAERAGVHCRIIDKYNEIFAATGTIELNGHIGQTISIIPLTGDVSVSATNLKYPLDHLELCIGSSRGISNEFLKNTARITVNGGYALIAKIFNQ